MEKEKAMALIDKNRNNILDMMKEVENCALVYNGLYESLYMDGEDGTLYTGEEADASSQPERVWNGTDTFLYQAHETLEDVESGIDNVLDGLECEMSKEDFNSIPSELDDSEKIEYIYKNFPDAKEGMLNTARECIVDNMNFNEILDDRIDEIRESGR